jgi:NAD-dependent dihydropyrimidine dehydrogenase PreA subunit
MDGVKIEIDRDACNKCKRCVDACFVDVFRWEEIEKRPIAAYPEDCVWCFACEIARPEQCIEVIPDTPGRLCEPY